MFALLGAKSAAVGLTRGRQNRFWCGTLAATAVAGLLSASMPATVSLAGNDPADPAARVAGVRYRSTIAPFTSLRPSTPKPWQERNQSAAPRPKQDK
jgi:hypothetical protein